MPSALLLPDEFSVWELFEAVAGLSYIGDPRMGVAENPHKVRNIVAGMRDEFLDTFAGCLSLSLVLLYHLSLPPSLSVCLSSRSLSSRSLPLCLLSLSLFSVSLCLPSLAFSVFSLSAFPLSLSSFFGASLSK